MFALLCMSFHRGLFSLRFLQQAFFSGLFIFDMASGQRSAAVAARGQLRAAVAARGQRLLPPSLQYITEAPEGLRLAGDSPPSLQYITEAPTRKALVDGSEEEVPAPVVRGSTELEVIERSLDQPQNYVEVVLIGGGRSRTAIALDTRRSPSPSSCVPKCTNNSGNPKTRACRSKCLLGSPPEAGPPPEAGRMNVFANAACQLPPRSAAAL